MSPSTHSTNEANVTSEPSYTKLQTTNLLWYTDDVEGQLTPELRHLFETHSAIPADQVIPHIRDAPKKLRDIRAYPCTGLYIVLVHWNSYHSALPLILSALRSSEEGRNQNAPKVLDVGTYFNHDLRALHFAGVPLKSLYGLDVVSFVNLGLRLFNDRDRFNIAEQLVVGDILDLSVESEAANMLDEKMKAVWCSTVLHEFTRDQCIAACRGLVRFAEGLGSLIVGCQVGSRTAESDLDMRAITKEGERRGYAALQTECAEFRTNVETRGRGIKYYFRCQHSMEGVN